MSVALAAIFLGGCKTTEKNYRLAYERAQQRAREGLDDEEYAMMAQEQLPPYVRGTVDSVRVKSVPMMWQWSPQAVDSGRRADPKTYNLTVGTYRMLTNAKAHAENLAADGWPCVVMRSGGAPDYLVVARRSDNLDTIAASAREFAARHPAGVVGMPVAVAYRPLR